MTPYARKHKADRDAWRDSMPQRCMWCGKVFHGRGRMEVHEILPRGRAAKSWAFRANYLLVHQECHSEAAESPDAVQLACKLKYDPEHFNLTEWLERRNPNAMSYVTMEEIRQVQTN